MIEKIKEAFMKIVEKVGACREDIGFLIWQRKHDKVSRKYFEEKMANPIEYDPAWEIEYKDDLVTEEQALAFYNNLWEQAEKNKKEQEEKEAKKNSTVIIDSPEALEEVYNKVSNGEMDIETLSDVDVLRVYAYSLQKLEVAKEDLAEQERVEAEIRQLETENEQLEEEIAKMKEEIRTKENADL